MRAKPEATVEDLYRVPEHGKAELVHGELRLMSPTGGLPGLRGGGSLCDRKSFSPDAAFYTGQLRMEFLEGAPVFAVEVRSEEDYGPAAEREMAEKRADYFAAGTQVVWDVDLNSDEVVRVYRASHTGKPTRYRRTQAAEAEPAIPGWAMPVEDLFPPNLG